MKSEPIQCLFKDFHATYNREFCKGYSLRWWAIKDEDGETIYFIERRK